MKDLSRKVSLLCPVCGNDQFASLDFEFDDLQEAPDESRIQCSDCKTIFTKEEIIQENAEKIDIAVSEVKTDVAKEMEKELKKALKKWKR